MHHSSEKKKRGGENPQVSVRLNVRPLCANWKPVKRYECDGSQSRAKEAPSPAEDQLDTAVWKTKNVRTDVVKAVTVVPDEEEMKNEDGKDPLISMCNCEACAKADQTPTTLELSPKQTRDDLYLVQNRKLKEIRKRKNTESKSSKNLNNRSRNRRQSHSNSIRSVSTPPPVPPNSVISPESSDQWHKLYQDAHHKTKPIDFRKIRSIPGQIGMSDLEPEDPSTPPPTANAPGDNPHRSPNLPILKPPPISPPSNIPETLYKSSPRSHQPPLVPQPPTQPQSNIVILPAPVDNSQIPQENNSKNDKVNDFKSGSSASSSSLIFMPSSPIAPENALPSHSNVSMIRKMENLFYSSESNWWFLAAFVMLTIFAYRSSMDQHTCYYD